MTPLKETDLKSAKVFTWPQQLSTPTEVIQSLREKTRLRIIRSPIYSKLVLQFIGSWSYLLAHFLNKSHVFNVDTLEQELRRLEHQISETKSLQYNEHHDRRVGAADDRKAPLLTFSNHISCIDDPILWASLLPLTFYSTNTESVRWTAAAFEICFSKPWHSALFSLGKTFPIIRGAGLDQPAMDFASAILEYNYWLHLFPEGRVMRDDNQQVISNKDRGYIFKWGIAKLILDYFRSATRENKLECDHRSIRILPFYHLGLDKILPIGRPYVPRFGKHITIYIRPKVIEMNAQVLQGILQRQQLSNFSSKSRSNDEILRIKLTNYLEDELETLIEPATKLHQQINRNQ